MLVAEVVAAPVVALLVALLALLLVKPVFVLLWAWDIAQGSARRGALGCQKRRVLCAGGAVLESGSASGQPAPPAFGRMECCRRGIGSADDNRKRRVSLPVTSACVMSTVKRRASFSCSR